MAGPLAQGGDREAVGIHVLEQVGPVDIGDEPGCVRAGVGLFVVGSGGGGVVGRAMRQFQLCQVVELDGVGDQHL